MRTLSSHCHTYSHTPTLPEYLLALFVFVSLDTPRLLLLLSFKTISQYLRLSTMCRWRYALYQCGHHDEEAFPELCDEARQRGDVPCQFEGKPVPILKGEPCRICLILPEHDGPPEVCFLSTNSPLDSANGPTRLLSRQGEAVHRKTGRRPKQSRIRAPTTGTRRRLKLRYMLRTRRMMMGVSITAQILLLLTAFATSILVADTGERRRWRTSLKSKGKLTGIGGTSSSSSSQSSRSSNMRQPTPRGLLNLCLAAGQAMTTSRLLSSTHRSIGIACTGRSWRKP